MVFVNERLTQEEMEEFKARAIPNPGNKIFILEPYKWTIDRENNGILIWCLRERFEPYDEFFLLLWKDTPIPLKLRSSWISGPMRIRECELRYIDIPKELEGKRDVIIRSLKDALVVYAFNGSPNDPFNETTKVEFKF